MRLIIFWSTVPLIRLYSPIYVNSFLANDPHDMFIPQPMLIQFLSGGEFNHFKSHLHGFRKKNALYEAFQYKPKLLQNNIQQSETFLSKGIILYP